MGDSERAQVPESSRLVLTWVAEQLRLGYTGRFELECQDGGIRGVRCLENLDPQEIKRRLRNSSSR